MKRKRKIKPHIRKGINFFSINFKNGQRKEFNSKQTFYFRKIALEHSWDNILYLGWSDSKAKNACGYSQEDFPDYYETILRTIYFAKLHSKKVKRICRKKIMK